MIIDEWTCSPVGAGVVVGGGSVLLWGGDAGASEVRVPLTVPYIMLTEALKAELYNGAANRADLWQASDCEYLYAENPRFSRQGDLLQLETDSNLNVGTLAGANCINAISWQGIIEALAVPYVTADWKLKFHVTDLNLYNRQHQKTVLAGRGFDLIKGYFVPRMEQFSFDLKTPLTQLTQLIENGTLDEYRGAGGAGAGVGADRAAGDGVGSRAAYNSAHDSAAGAQGSDDRAAHRS